ncbi:hypothetical protein BKA64DRAFT_687615 [Cadophora sp. MPI-SDFR-AT-0126]|nr:hypothetical protein BKA64DRAFT_687615 [Leotiomycetes sp. MPI-SDFR-AT-0126]
MGPLRREHRRPVRLFLRQNISSLWPTWGYTIYRTAYTPESESAWPSLLTKLVAYIHYEIFEEIREHEKYFELTHGPLAPSPNEEVWATYKPRIMSDKGLYDGASVEDIRRFWKADVEGRGEPINGSRTGDNVCLVINEEVFAMVRDAPEPDKLVERENRAWIRVIDGAWKPEHNEGKYTGV